MNAEKLTDFLAVLEHLKQSTRHSFTSDGRQESVAEHSWRCALLALLLREEFPEDDMDRVVRMCLVHDFGEAVTGDIPVFLKTADDEIVEEQAVEAMLSPLTPEQREELTGLFAEIDARQTRESRIFRAIDRLEAVIQHNEAALSTWIPLEYELNLTHGAAECAEFPPLAALREEARRRSLAKIHTEQEDRP